MNSSQAYATSAKRRKGQRGKYRSLVVERRTLGGQCKLDVEVLDYVLLAIGENARTLVNFCGYVVRTTALMDANDWTVVGPKYGHAMWMQVKNKFKIKDNENELPRLQAFVMYALQRLYRYWKARLHKYYKECGATHEEHLEYPPEDFQEDQWRNCCETFNSSEFKTKKNNNVKPRADVIWLAEHSCKNDKGVLEWVADKRSKKIHTQLHQLVQEKDKEDVPQTQEEMLIHVLGSKSGYTRGKGSGNGGSLKARLQQEQQHKIRDQQNKINELRSQLEANDKKLEEYKSKQQRSLVDVEERLMQRILARST